MTDDKEERIITFDELRKQPGSIIERQEWWENLPLAPKHTDEEYEQLYLDWEGFAELVEAAIQRIKEQCVIINDLRCELDLAMQRIKELENPQPCTLCGKSLYEDNPACAVSHKEARK